MQWLDELKCAEEAAYAAGEKLRNVSRSAIVNNSGRDIKHTGDLESEALILELLRSKYNYPILAEESLKTGKDLDKEQPFWIVDPLDGTLNFSKNIGFSCVSIALWQSNKPILGVIYDFQREELFKGIVDHGAQLNEELIYVSNILSPDRAVLTTGFPVNRDFSSHGIGKFINNIMSFKKIRLLGSAGLSMAYVACGRADAYFEEDIMLWDVAAGIALVKAAGGFVLVEDSKRKKWAKNIRAGNIFMTENKHDSI